MPSDVTGVNVFEPATGEFRFRPGPLFADIVLADEINRAPAKTQAALLEAMQEHQVSVDGQTRELPRCFTVVATQNPIEYEGTYPLPEAQLDRFLMKVTMDYQAAGSTHAFTGRQSARSSARQRLPDTGRSSGHGLAGLASSHPTDTRGRNRGVDARRLHPIATSPSGDSAVERTRLFRCCPLLV